MFPARYFPNRAFAPRYFPKVGSTATPLSITGKLRAREQYRILASERYALRALERYSVRVEEKV